MTISSSLNAGVTGLHVNSSRLAAISDNISNSNTYGYKRIVTDFHSLVMGQTSGAYSAGGVRATNHLAVQERGTLSSTQNATDLAISGRGMLPIMSVEAFNNGQTGGMRLTTTGSFYPDESGYLRSSSGEALLGWPATGDGMIPPYPRDSMGGLEPIRIPTGISEGNPTTRVSLGVNLPSSSTANGASAPPEVMSLEYYGNFGEPQELEMTFTPVPGTGGVASNTWDVAITDQAQAGAAIGSFRIVFDASPVNGGTISSVTATAPGGTGPVLGSYDAASGNFSVTTASGPLDIDIGTPLTTGGLSQLSNGFTPYSITKDGTPVGNLVGVDVDASGMLNALFDTGLTKTLYQIPVADVPNPNGLRAVDNRVFEVSPESGGLSLWDAGDGPVGSMLSYTREESATDVAGELTDLIQTQRAYSSNAKVIQTVDEMLQETTNIKR
jgi:flagellar hook protein FlgE